MGDLLELRPTGWHALELDLLDMLALTRRLRLWLQEPEAWTDGQARAAALESVGAVARAIALARAESCPKIQHDFLLIAGGRAVGLKWSVAGLDPSEHLADWQDRIEDLGDALEMAGLQRFGDMNPPGGEMIPW